MDGLAPGEGPQEPDKVSVIVHSAKNLQSKKKGRCKFSVIFGVGSKKFRTDIVEDVFGSPVWNTEAEIDVDNPSHHLNLIATEKDEPLGQVVIPLSELSTTKPYHGKKVSLGPHKKCSDPVGEIVVSAWISAMRAQDTSAKNSPSGALKGLKKMKSKISHSPLMRRKSKNSEYSTAGMKGSMSVGDLAGMGRRKTNLMSVPSDSMCSINSTDSDNSNHFTASAVDIRDSLKKPEVSGISPKEGPTDGGTRLTIRGINLGRSRDDIKALYVCGHDCLSTVEYESTSKLYCTTGRWRAGAGDIVVETVSGGKGSSMVQFTFVAPQQDVLNVSPAVSKRTSPLIGRRKSPMTHKKRSSDTSMLSTGSMSIPEEGTRPEVSGVSPKEGPAEGGTRLTIRGDNFGTGHDDIICVQVCGHDCYNSMEWESPRKLHVITKPGRPGSGDIIVETGSGGRGTSTVQFTYLEPPVAVTTPKALTTTDLSPDQLYRQSAPSPAFSDDDDNLLKPEVTGISPKEGPAEGNTRLTIRGINLGRNKNDVIGLSICNANCLPMMEWESPMKLYVTTPPWRPGAGPIIVETHQGGKGSSLVQYTFKAFQSSPAPSPSLSTSKSTPELSGPPSKPPRKAASSTPVTTAAPTPSQPIDLSGLDLTVTPDTTDAGPDILITSATPRGADSQTTGQSAQTYTLSGSTLDETDDFGGATPYPDEVSGYSAEFSRIGETSRVDSAPTGTAATRSRSGVTSSSPHNTSSPHSTSVNYSQPADKSPSSPHRDTPKMSPSREGKRQAPLPPSHQKPPVYPTNPKSTGGQNTSSHEANVNAQNRRLPTTPVGGNVIDTNLYDKSWETNDKPMTTTTGEDKKEKYIKEQQEQHTQSGPTRPELMEEIRRVKIENRELREQNHTMKQYLENLLSHVMQRCPDVLCVDHSSNMG